MFRSWKYPGTCRQFVLGLALLASSAEISQAGFTTFEESGASAAAITPTRDAFRTAVGGGSIAGPNGSFGGLRREINWDGVPAAKSDPNPFPGDTFAARGALFTTSGTGFLVSSASGGATPTLFGFGSDFQAFSAEKLFTAVGSNITDVTFVVPGTATPATTSAFGAIFVDAEVAGLSKIEFFDQNNSLIYSHDVPVGNNQGLSFLGAVANNGERISRVRITAGLNTILGNGVLGNPNDDVVVLDDFLYAEPLSAVTPEPSSLVLASLGAICGLIAYRRRQSA